MFNRTLILRNNFSMPMYNPIFRKNKRILILFLITTTLSFFTFSQMIWNTNNFSSSTKSYTESQLVNRLRSADYYPEFGNIGENMNITMHQSYFNTSFNTIVNISITDGNNFTLPCPTDVNFNSSYTNITVNNVVAPNKTLDVETNPGYPPNALEEEELE